MKTFLVYWKENFNEEHVYEAVIQANDNSDAAVKWAQHKGYIINGRVDEYGQFEVQKPYCYRTAQMESRYIRGKYMVEEISIIK